MTLEALMAGLRAWFDAALPDHGMTALIVFAFVSGLARGFSGFGAALIFIPLAGAVIGPKLTSPVLLVIDGIATLGMIPAAWRDADRPEVFTMAVGCAFGVPAGTAALALADPLLLRWMISVIAICLLALLVSGWRYHGRPVAPLSAAIGLIAGLFSGAAQLGGPPVVAYWLGGKKNFARVRSNVILYFSISTVVTFISYYFGGLFVSTVFALTIVTLPAYAAGLWGGSRLFGLARESTFRMTCYILIAVSSIGGMPVFDSLLR